MLWLFVPNVVESPRTMLRGDGAGKGESGQVIDNFYRYEDMVATLGVVDGVVVHVVQSRSVGTKVCQLNLVTHGHGFIAFRASNHDFLFFLGLLTIGGKQKPAR